jgi:hypothetical protein
LLQREDLPAPYSRLTEAPFLDDPISFLFMWAAVERGLHHAKSVSADLHVTGDGGDNVLQASDVYLADLLNWRSIPIFIRHAVGGARKKKQSPLSWMLAAIQLRLTSYESWLEKQSKRVSFPSIYSATSLSTWQWSGALFRGDWITQEAREWVSAALATEVSNIKPIHPNPSIHSVWTSLFSTAAVARSTQQLGERLGLKIQFPYLNQSIVQTCFGVRSYERDHPRAFKPLLKQALADVLPETLLQRASKGNYTPDLYYGFQQNYEEICDLFRDSMLEKCGIIDLPRFCQALDKVKSGLPVGLWELNLTISMELWLQQVNRK